MKRRKNPLPYIPPGHYLAYDLHNRPVVEKAYPYAAADKLPAAVRLLRRIARGDIPADVARAAARRYIARIDAGR